MKFLLGSSVQVPDRSFHLAEQRTTAAVKENLTTELSTSRSLHDYLFGLLSTVDWRLR